MLLTLTFFIFPGQNYYQTRNLVYIPPQVRASAFDNLKISNYPLLISENISPNIAADSVIVVDLNSGVVLFEKNANKKMYPASTTKLMTALVALDYYKPEQVLTVMRLVNNSEESEMGLKVGDQISVKNLLYGLLIPSGNDAAYTLADNYPGGIENFVYSMNKKALVLNMFGTHFYNPSGTDDPRHYTTARNLALLAQSAMINPLIAQIVKTNWSRVSDISGTKTYSLQNVNQLLVNYAGTIGIKTGFTDLAGECLISAVNRNGHTVLSVVLKSPDRFGESMEIYDWAFANYKFTPPAKLEE